MSLFSNTIYLAASNKNALVVKFVAISFKASEGTTYYYRLSKGEGNDWKPAQTNTLEFAALQSGKYTLEIKAINGFGVESQIKQLNFEVEKKFAEKWWVRILALLLLALIIWWLFAWRFATLRKKAKNKLDTNLRMASLEQMALKAQMNPHFIFNCLNSIQQYIIEKDELGANKFISKFSKIIRQTLENSGKESISIAEEVAFLNDYLTLEKMRFEDKFTFSIVVDSAIDTTNTFIPPMLLQPFIENCIRHGIRLKESGDGIISLSINDHKNFVICRIEDNGIGREAAAKYKTTEHIQYQSKGMKLTEQRIEMLNTNKNEIIELAIHDVKNNNITIGTLVEISFPKSFLYNQTTI